MAVTKITEKTVATSLKDAAHVLVTQPENIDGSMVESLRRVPMNMIKESISNELGLCVVDGMLCVAFDVNAVTESDFTLTLPNNTVTIGEGAFEGTNYEVVVIPESCVEIKSRAFAACTNLKTVKIPASVISIADDAFAGNSADMMFQTPVGSYADRYAELHNIKTFT